MKFKTFVQIDYSLYFSLVGFITTAISSLLFFIFFYMGWETEKYPYGKIRLILYFSLIITGLYLIDLARRYFKIDSIMNNGKADKAEIIKHVKEKNDCIKLYLKTTERCFICSLHRSRNNRSILDNEFNEGDYVDIKHHKKNAVLTKFYT